MRPEPIHILILLIVILVIFGAPKLPMIAKNLGKSAKIFKSEIKDLRGDEGEPGADRGAERHEITDAPERPADVQHRASRPEDAAAPRPSAAPGDEHRPRS